MFVRPRLDAKVRLLISAVLLITLEDASEKMSPIVESVSVEMNHAKKPVSDVVSIPTAPARPNC